MNVTAGRPAVPGPDHLPRWGLGDVAAGIVASFLLVSVVGSVVVVVTGWTDLSDAPIWGLALLQVPLWCGYVGAVVVAGRFKGRGIVEDFGLRSTALDVPVGLVIGVLTQVVAVPLLYWPLLELFGTDSDELARPARELAGRADSTAAWVLFALLVGVGAPIVEELFYRGLFHRALLKRGAASWVAVVVTALVFAAAHLQALQFAGLALFGLVAGALTARTGRIGAAIWAHIGFNLTTVVALYLSQA